MDTREQLLFAACLLPTLVVATAAIVSLVIPDPEALPQVATVSDYADIELP
jgi:hypothetical protein